MRDHLRELLAGGKTKTLSRAEFQTICDDTKGVSSAEALLDFLHHAVPVEDFKYLKFVECSAKTDLGLDVLLAQIKESVRNLLAERPLLKIGAGRRRVHDHLRDLLAAGQTNIDPKRPGRGDIVLRTWGKEASRLLDWVLKLVQELRVGQPSEVIRKKTTPERPRLDPETKEIPTPQPVPRHQQPDDGKRAVYVSYAWGEDLTPAGRQREEVVHRLGERLKAGRVEFIRDREKMEYGDLISVFMRSLSLGECVLVVLSEKYLQSPYCMTELHAIYQNSKSHRAEFLRRIVPVSLDVRIGRAVDWARHAKYWKEQHDELDGYNTSGVVIGEAGYAELCRMKRWHVDVADMLSHINDMLHPVGFDAIVADDFAGVRELLAQRGLTLP